MKKFLTGIRGKQILVSGLVVLVVIAGYYRWTVDKNNSALAVMNADEIIKNETEKIDEGDKEGSEIDDYFARARYERDFARSEAAELLAVSASDSGNSAELMAKAQEKIETTAKNMESETAIENMVIAKGYSDCIAFVDDTGARVIVKSDSLKSQDVAQIKDIVIEKTGFKATEIKISTKQ